MPRPENGIRIRRKDWVAMQAHAASLMPEEVCGFVAGVRNRSTAVFPVENITHRSDVFQMETKQQLEALMALDDNGWELLAIYHSHPGGSFRPSELDYQGHYPECALLIWIPDLGGWSCRAYRIDENNEFAEISVMLLLK